MKTQILTIALLIFVLLPIVDQGIAQDIEMTPYAGVEEWAADSDERMEWWREARFGLFIHWGLYAAAGGYWPPDPDNGKLYPQHYSEWIQNHAKVPSSEYAKLTKPLFTAENYDAAEWAALAKRAGMRYAVLTTKHHDGFTLFNSAADFSVDNPITGGSNISPADRDLVAEYTDAFRDAGLKVGYYYSLWDWQHPDAPAHGPSTGGERKNERYIDYMHEHFRELLTKYGRVDILWADFSSVKYQASFWQTGELLRQAREWQPEMVINNRFWEGLRNLNADFLTPEKRVPSTGYPGVDWEVCHTMNESFGFSFHDERWKSVDDTIRLLVEIVSKGGNLLLNVGPTADGSIPEQAVEILEGVGEWMDVNSSAIYGTEAGPFPRLNWGYASRKGKTIYLFVTDWPQHGELRVPLTNKIRSAKILGGGRLKSKNTDGAVLLSGLPKDPPHSAVSVIAIELKGEPELVEVFLEPGSDGILVLDAADAELQGALRLQNEPKNIGYWTNLDYSASWKARLSQPGRYKVVVKLACPPGSGGRLKLAVGEQVLSADVPDTGDWQSYTDLEIGELLIDQQALGESSITFRLEADQLKGVGVANIREIRLSRVD